MLKVNIESILKVKLIAFDIIQTCMSKIKFMCLKTLLTLPNPKPNTQGNDLILGWVCFGFFFPFLDHISH